MMKKVSFTEMENGNKEDYQLLEKYEKDFERKTADRIIKYLAAQTSTLEGYQITRLEPVSYTHLTLPTIYSV